MELVGQKYKKRTSRVNRIRSGVTVLAVAAIASGCAQGERPAGESRPAAGQEAGAARARPPMSSAERLRSEQAARVAVAKKWGLKRVPLTPPAPPAKKPEITTRDGFEVDDHEELGLPPVFTTVPTKEKVLFLTIDDGAEKDPAFLRMMTELKVPYTAFLSDYLVKEDYRYFKKMQDAGVVLNNHTLHHPYLPGMSYQRQKHEICGMQDVIQKHYGKRPLLFRPPYGNYNQDTLRAAKACGVKYAPLWDEEVFVDHWEYREWDRDLHPGDIVLSHFRGRDDWKGTMPDMVRRFLNMVTEKGYAVGRLEDYL
ncbi:polysaccharide deacetylase family protein [Streptomyces acidiscabies]|uniref:Polysaccharide deacetylase family protein n=3 Tax=Streptomyces acidiscabies TaxID=42234 RepID=A0AAP6BGE8_9ACTN|nr:polysaccharide deacetylase family protein [Streptomyces acidiscabies]MBP5937495.1 polysaccharide deacetylase family protein [Streptomyces sp. LBUM 1476]MBZ3914422.1 polysaccharide deacetylase family protein [Streptomyces acidiscabies]MDX2964290.1 polysaccharide deacetylase family protein [Streptomyces acidiscabies]MDX3017111.1 polysaccharide deacetylase family protein [Streptomyces acidiscabies]MDX3789062.1 polysaccharide deacetylase family protein [Streptomyces acidiscabies]